ncbi:MAG: zinc ribbon domain-containing protein [Bryobacteraceae bacterium]|nr:zinc ribbon domain-containing protein [Bryobacteraceae bacterium]
MPLYEYKCANCGDVFEVIQKFSDAPLTTHQACGGAVQRLISSSALQFKGTGWYVTDYAKGNGKSNGKADGGAGESSSKSAGSSTTDTTAKPAVTTPSPAK